MPHKITIKGKIKGSPIWEDVRSVYRNNTYYFDIEKSQVKCCGDMQSIWYIFDYKRLIFDYKKYCPTNYDEIEKHIIKITEKGLTRENIFHLRDYLNKVIANDNVTVNEDYFFELETYYNLILTYKEKYGDIIIVYLPDDVYYNGEYCEF